MADLINMLESESAPEIAANFQRIVAELSKMIPPCPAEEDGTYSLTATVADGVVEYEWAAMTEAPK